MRVVHVTPSLNMTFPSGIDVHVFELVNSLTAKGIENIVYTAKNGGKQGTYNFEVKRFPIYSPSNLPSLIGNNSFFQTLIKRSWFPIHTLQYFKKLKRERNVIHIHGHEYPVSFLAMLAALKSNTPTLLTIHGVERGLESVLPFQIIRRIARPTFFNFIINKADIIIAPSEQVLKILKKYTPRQVMVIPHGILTKRFQRVKRKPRYVLYLGRFFPVKGSDIFIKAAAKVLKKVDIQFLMVGYGTQKEELKNLAKKLGITRSITIKEKVSYYEVPEIMSNASVFVSPGVSGYSLLEAAVTGVPIVSGRIGWNISCIGRNSAVYVNPQNIEEVAEAIVNLLNDKDLAQKTSNKAKKFVKEHRSWDSLSDKYIKLYKRLLNS